MSKHLLINRLLLFIAFTVFLSSCGKDDKDDNPTPGNSDCLLVKSKSDTDESEFIYDNNNRLTRINQKENNQIVSYQTFAYNSNNKVSKTTDFEMSGATGQQVSYSTYDYTSDGLRSKETKYSGDATEADSYITFDYNASKQITQANSFEDNGNGFEKTEHTTFVYDAKGNISKATSYDADDDLQYELGIEYDAKENIIKMIPAFTSADLDLFTIPATFSANNITKVTIKASPLGTGPLVDVGTLNTTYTVNTDGLIEKIAMSLNVPLAGVSENQSATLEYSCK